MVSRGSLLSVLRRHVTIQIQSCPTRDPGLRSWKPRWLQLGSPIRHAHGRGGSASFKTALQAPNLSLHAPGSAWRQSAKVWRQPRRSSPRQQQIGFRGGRVEQGRAPSRGIARSEDCACVNTILSGSERCLQTWGRVQEDAGSHRIPQAGALSIEVGASWCPSNRTRFERGRCNTSSPRASGEVGGGSPGVRALLGCLQTCWR